MVHFVPTTEKTMAEGLARLFRDNLWRLHRLSKSIISDRGPQFAAELIRELNELLGIATKLLMAFYPQTEGPREDQISSIVERLYSRGRHIVTAQSP